MRADVRNFPAVMRDAGGWRRDMAEQGIEDLAAIMEPGMAALLAVHARGISPASAALALWQEFHAARAALQQTAVGIIQNVGVAWANLAVAAASIAKA